MNYLVIEVYTNYAIVLDCKKNYIKVVNKNYTVGDKIFDIVPIKKIEKKKKLPIFPFTGFFASFLLFFVLNITLFHKPYAKIYITVNPEIELELDEKQKVLKVNSMNEDGKRLIQGYYYKNKDAYEVTEELLDKALSLGMINKNKEVLLEIDVKDEIWYSDVSFNFSDEFSETSEDSSEFKLIIEHYTHNDFIIEN